MKVYIARKSPQGIVHTYEATNPSIDPETKDGSFKYDKIVSLGPQERKAVDGAILLMLQQSQRFLPAGQPIAAVAINPAEVNVELDGVKAGTFLLYKNLKLTADGVTITHLGLPEAPIYIKSGVCNGKPADLIRIVDCVPSSVVAQGGGATKPAEQSQPLPPQV